LFIRRIKTLPKKYNLKIVIILSILTYSNSVYSYDKKLHFKINEKSVISSNLSIILKNKLGIEGGIEKILSINNKTQTAIGWISYGGEAEDLGRMNSDIDPTTRAFNHFHDPLNDWDSAGLDNPYLEYLCSYYYGRPPVSIILWGMNPESQDFIEIIRGNWSYEKAKEYYFGFLTGQDDWTNIVAFTQQDREKLLGASLMALGQVMHLLQDCSVPLHTRNDVHVIPLFYSGQFLYGTFENYTAREIDSLNYSADFPDPLLIKQPNPDPNYQHLSPVTGLFDRNQYNQGDAIPASDAPIGLTEYSNANFLTQDTMWTYPHPAISDTNYNESLLEDPETVDAEDGQIDYRIYLRKTTGDPLEHLAAAGYWYYHLEMMHQPEKLYAFVLDEKCFSDYAAKLIPKAVGYSAALLDYFFRGSIEITGSNITMNYPSGNYETKVGFNKVSIMARNNSPEAESMNSGSVYLVAKYKVDEKDGYLNMPNRHSDFQYITVPFLDDGEQIAYDENIPSDEEKQFDFDLTSNPIPLCAKEIHLYLVYRGYLGNEEDGIGVGYLPFTGFRTIGIGLSNEGVYALSDLEPENINPAFQGFDRLSLSAKNIDPDNDVMSNGAIKIIIKYLPAYENQFQNPPPKSTEGFQYIVKDIPPQSIPQVPEESADSAQFSLDLSDTPIPLWATDIYLYLVYSGQIGANPCKTAVGFKDISEPTPIVYYNSMDKICIYGNMVDAGDEALSIATTYGMQNQWDVYPHDRSDVFIRFSSIENPQQLSYGSFYNYKIPYQAAGEFKTLYLITGYDFAFTSSDGLIIPLDSRDNFNHFIGNYVGGVLLSTAVRNQVEVVPPDSEDYNPDQTGYIRYIPLFSPFRNIENGWLNVSLRNRPMPENHPDNVNCHY
jgi:hypothetical protein